MIVRVPPSPEWQKKKSNTSVAIDLERKRQDSKSQKEMTDAGVEPAISWFVVKRLAIGPAGQLMNVWRKFGYTDQKTLWGSVHPRRFAGFQEPRPTSLADSGKAIRRLEPFQTGRMQVPFICISSNGCFRFSIGIVYAPYRIIFNILPQEFACGWSPVDSVS